MEKLRILTLEVGKGLEVKEIEHNSNAMRKLVGGHRERIGFPNNIDLWINEEGIIHDLPFNFITFVIDNGVPQPVHTILGNVFFASLDEEGNTVSLNDIQIKRIEKMFEVKRDACIVNVR